VLIIDGGRIVAEGAPDELRRRTGGDSITFTLQDPLVAARAAELLGRIDGVIRTEAREHDVRLDVPAAHETLAHMLAALAAADIELEGVEVHRPTLDDAFLELTGRALRDA